MRLTRKSLAFLAALFLSAVVARAQAPAAAPSADEQQTLDEYVKMLRGDLTARRDSAMQAVLEMNETERKAFTPLKQAYDKELSEIGKRRLALSRDYMKVHTQLTAEKSTELFDSFCKLDEDRMALRKKYFGLMSKQVSPIVAVQFVQLERQFETMGDLKLATQMPLAVK